ncbi:histidine triad nucleotide-binding protein [Kibdelosporangium philippinense]|uniref:Histidine triad nucleotide-binding protein n=1 Tax=Kibdelosporangium philippinense TaxID=211113 RepID=A0ABS8ZVA2_9PSEU|nr:histidine triad nucleotide-binding protein [Kibdelosporangium philippinense]MCE7011631.1 histidine triad nucleotide-binding protein [Kibdelosporangium philippinense]
MNPACLFCRIIAGELPSTVVHETATTFAFRDLHPQARTHILIVPRVHFTDAVDLAKGQPELLTDITLAAGEIAEQEGLAEPGYRLVFNTGRDAGQTVFHVHMHLLGGEQLGHFGAP